VNVPVMILAQLLRHTVADTDYAFPALHSFVVGAHIVVRSSATSLMSYWKTSLHSHGGDIRQVWGHRSHLSLDEVPKI
jgi:hypothetical protein